MPATKTVEKPTRDELIRERDQWRKNSENDSQRNYQLNERIRAVLDDPNARVTKAI